MIGRYHNHLEAIPGDFRRCALSAAHEPTLEHRALMAARRNDLDAALAGCDEATVRRAVGMLRSVMAVQQVDEATQKLQRAAYLSTLTKFPGWAVERACQEFLDGSRGEGIHAPKPGEIANVCRLLIREAQAERARINAVLDAEIVPAPTEEDRKAVADAHAKFVAEAVQRSAEVSAILDSPRSDTPSAERRAVAEHLRALEEKRKAETEGAGA